MKIGHSKFIEMHEDASDFINLHPSPIGILYMLMYILNRLHVDKHQRQHNAIIKKAFNYSSFIPFIVAI